MNRKPASIAWAAAFLCAVACQTGGQDRDEEYQDEQEELQALLRDAPLKNVPAGVPRSAVTEPAAAGDSLTLASGPPIGVWAFDDCTPSRTHLFDSTFNDNTAYRSVGVACADGIEGSVGVAISVTEDIVYVPDQPSFTFEDGVTVAGWFKPFAVGGTRSLFRKRDKGTSSFALLLNAGNFQFVVSLGNGQAISVSSPQRAKASIFQHVAGTYDGSTLRLYVDGFEVNSFTVPGAIPLGPGPLLIGNDGSERRFNGVIDQTLFATHALDAAEVQALTCFPQPAGMVVTPGTITSPPGVPAVIDVALINNNPAACAPIQFNLETFSAQDLILDPPPFTPIQSAPVASGTTGHMSVTATASDTVEPGTTLFVQFLVDEPTTGFFQFGFVDFEVAEPIGCHVSTPRELMIKHVSVVDDPVRTAFDPTSTDPRNGVWTFKHLVEEMAPTPEAAPAMVEAVMQSFTTPQVINGFSVQARPFFQGDVLDSWPRTGDGSLDLAQAPFRLQAIVNRFDLRDLSSGDAGEGRFVFAFHDPNDFFPMEATMIFEYKLPASTEADVLGWAQAFHALGGLQFGEEYNAALQAITQQFAGRGARPGQPNGSAINTVRTNEIQFSFIWELREFRLSPSTRLLVPVPVALTPNVIFNFTNTLIAYIDANQAAIIDERHTVPELLDGQPFQAGAIFNDLGTWFAPGVDPEARHHFALNTCNGCHSFDETRTVFLQIGPRVPGSEASLSDFLTGVTVSDPATGQARTFNDLGRRNADLRAIVCGDPAAAGTTLRKGISRVH